MPDGQSFGLDPLQAADAAMQEHAPLPSVPPVPADVAARLRYHTVRTTRWSTEPQYPGRFGSPTHTVKRTTDVTKLQYLGDDGQWIDVPHIVDVIDETKGENFPPLSPEFTAAIDRALATPSGKNALEEALRNMNHLATVAKPADK